MTATRHRADRAHPANPTAAAAGAGDSTGDRGGVRGAGPRGMWWVAWRQHRTQVAVALLVIAIIAAALVVFRLVLAARLHAAGCSLTDQDSCSWPAGDTVWTAGFENGWHVLRAALPAVPILLGVFVGAPLFPREFEQRTHVFALTQSVGRLRWWATKVAVAGVPVVLGLLGLGFCTQWVESAWMTAGALRDGTFQVRSIMPAVFGLLTLAIAVTVGTVIRSVVPSLVAAFIVAGGIVLVVAFPLRPHLLPATRAVIPISAALASNGAETSGTGLDNPNSWYLGSGYLDASGREMSFDYNKCTIPAVGPAQGDTAEGAAIAAANDAIETCMRDQGIVAEYRDYLPAGMLWPLRLVVTGISAALAAIALALGALRLRSAGRSGR